MRSQRCSPELKFFKAAVQSCSPKPLPKASPARCAHSCSPKEFPQSFDSANMFAKTSPKTSLQSGPRKLSPKCLSLPRNLFPSESVFKKLLSKATPQSCRFSSRFLSGTISIGIWGNALTLHVASRFAKWKVIMVSMQSVQRSVIDLYFLVFSSLKLLPEVVPGAASQ